MTRSGGPEQAAGTGHVDDVAGPTAAGTEGADTDPLVIRDAATGAAVPDAFQRLWNPHRMAYIDAGREGRGRGRGHPPFGTNSAVLWNMGPRRSTVTDM